MTPRQFGVRVYSSAEINDAVGLEKQYREFWNAKARDICGDKKSVGKLVEKIAMHGAINSSWILHKTELLKLEADELCSLATEIYPDEIAQSHIHGGIDIHGQLGVQAIEQGFYWYKYQASSNGSVERDFGTQEESGKLDESSFKKEENCF